jgi:transposase
VIEATYGWYWAVDLLRANGARVHLAHPLGNNWGNRRVKNDERDATDLADLLRLNRLAEAWIAPPEVRQLRELVRYRAKLVAIRSGFRAQIHAVLAKQGVAVPMTDVLGAAGQELLDTCVLDDAYAHRVQSLRQLIDSLTDHIAVLGAKITEALDGDDGYRALQQIPGVGPVLAAIFVVEIGDVHRFDSPHRLASWVGLTPRHHESDTTVHRGRITKQGSRLVRWAAVEAISRGRCSFLQDHHQRIATQRNSRNIGRVAAARKLIHLVYWALRDGHIRCLQDAA